MQFLSESLQIKLNSLPLHRVFHSIRFKVNKGWSTAVLLFLCPYVKWKERNNKGRTLLESPTLNV